MVSVYIFNKKRSVRSNDQLIKYHVFYFVVTGSTAAPFRLIQAKPLPAHRERKKYRDRTGV
jgi:hypothetical protein